MPAPKARKGSQQPSFLNIRLLSACVFGFAGGAFGCNCVWGVLCLLQSSHRPPSFFALVDACWQHILGNAFGCLLDLWSFGVCCVSSSSHGSPSFCALVDVFWWFLLGDGVGPFEALSLVILVFYDMFCLIGLGPLGSFFSNPCVLRHVVLDWAGPFGTLSLVIFVFYDMLCLIGLGLLGHFL